MTSSADLVVRDRTLAGHRWMLAIGLGAMLGAIVLGGGGRAAMRGIAMLEDRPRLWSVGGTLRVMAFGAGLCLFLRLMSIYRGWRLPSSKYSKETE